MILSCNSVQEVTLKLKHSLESEIYDQHSQKLKLKRLAKFEFNYASLNACTR